MFKQLTDNSTIIIWHKVDEETENTTEKETAAKGSLSPDGIQKWHDHYCTGNFYSHHENELGVFIGYTRKFSGIQIQTIVDEGVG